MGFSPKSLGGNDLFYMSLVGTVISGIFTLGFHEKIEESLNSKTSAISLAITGFLLGVVIWKICGIIRWMAIKKLLTYRDWLVNPRSLKTKLWVFCLKFLIPRKKQLNTFQDVLPKYPLPKLSDTCKRLLEVYEPLLSEKEFIQLSEEMEEFEKTEGPMLQKILEKRYQTEENWVSDIWDNYAYLSQRTPIIINTNIGTPTVIDQTTLEPYKPVKAVGRAASMAYYYLVFYEKIKDGTLPAILVLNLIPICSRRYKYLMACTRLPGEQMDKFECYPDSKHIIVIRRGVMYRINVHWKTPSGAMKLIPPEELQRQMQLILDDTSNIQEHAKSPAIFTAQDRITWSKERERLQSNKINAASLHDVESAIFHIVLGDTTPKNLTEESSETYFSRGYNLWCDKSITITVHEDSRCGLHFEHGTADATLHGRMMEFVWFHARWDEEGNAISGGTHPVVMPTKIPPPHKVEWDLKEFEYVIPSYEDDLMKRNADVDVIAFTLHHGKGAMKKCRVSPDGFMQMCLQLTFYRIHQTTPKTYESASTRFFKFGRTETIRPVSKSSVAFTKAMHDPSIKPSEKISLLKKAISCQHSYKLKAMNGEACDRHMFGLYIAAKMSGVQPKLFRNTILLAPDQLSTSQSPYTFDENMRKIICQTSKIFPAGGVFAPQTLDGYGVFYQFLHDNAMTIHITSYRSHPYTCSTKFGEELQRVIEDLKQLLNPMKN